MNLSGNPSRIAAGAVFEARGGETFSARRFRNEGTFRKTTGSSIVLALLRPPAGADSFVNAGLFEVAEGSLEANFEPGSFRNEGVARFSGGQLVLRLAYDQSAGETVLAGGILATRSSINIRGGELRGAGVAVCATLGMGGGTSLDPGSPIGVLEITNKLGDQVLGDGVLALHRTGSLIMDIGGRLPGVEHDQLLVTGDVRLDGTLQVRLANAFTPDLGEEFTLITAKTRRVTQFATETLPSLGAGRKFEVIYETNAVKLRVVPNP